MTKDEGRTTNSQGPRAKGKPQRARNPKPPIPTTSRQPPVASSTSHVTDHGSQVTSHESRITSDFWLLTSDYLRGVVAIVWKDLAAEARSKELVSAMLIFSLLAVMIFSFALDLDQNARATVIAGVLWVTF